jgi:hypothetical protein
MFDPNAGSTVPIFGGAPIRMFHGISDDFMPIQPCRDFVAQSSQ